MTQIIGLVGFKQSGKSTAASYLESKYGFVRHNFKDALVAELKENFPDLLREIAFPEASWFGKGVIEIEFAINKLFEEKPPLIRALMQNYGTEVRRKENPDYWVDQWTKKFWELERIVYRVVTDDVRFLNEAAMIRSAKCPTAIIRIIRTDITSGGDHSSETEQLEIQADYTIEVGPGEHEKMYNKLDEILCKQ
jgi:hypothetical protein